MTNREKYERAFIETFEADKTQLNDLQYQSIPAWDSVGHMMLINLLEDTFDIMIDVDDIIDLNTFEKGKEIMEKYDIEL